MYTIQIREVFAQSIAGIRSIVPNPQLESFFDQACREIRAYLSQIGVAAIADPMSLWHSSPGEIPDGFEIETCIPIERPVPAQGRIQPGELPAGTLASTIHEGPYDTMSAAFDAVWVWTQEHGYELAGPPRDVVLVGPDTTDNPTEYRTEIVYPIRKPT